MGLINSSRIRKYFTAIFIFGMLFNFQNCGQGFNVDQGDGISSLSSNGLSLLDFDDLEETNLCSKEWRDSLDNIVRRINLFKNGFYSTEASAYLSLLSIVDGSFNDGSVGFTEFINSINNAIANPFCNQDERDILSDIKSAAENDRKNAFEQVTRPKLSVTVGSFGTVSKPDSALVDFEIENKGIAGVQILEAQLGGTPGFRIELKCNAATGGPIAGKLNKGEKCGGIIHLDSSAVSMTGDISDVVNLTWYSFYTEGASVLTGRRLPDHTFDVSARVAPEPTSMLSFNQNGNKDFGNVEEGTNAMIFSVDVSNGGNKSTTVSADMEDGSGLFQIKAGDNGCTGTIASGGGSCTITVTMTPPGPTGNMLGEYTDKLSITEDGETKYVADLKVNIMARPTPGMFTLTGLGNASTFGRHATGSIIPADILTLKNTGEVGLTGIAISGVSSPFTATFISGTCGQGTLAANGECTLRVNLSSQTAGTFNQQLMVTSTEGESVSRQLSGEIYVPDNTNPTIDTFTASKTTANVGESITYSWTTTDIAPGTLMGEYTATGPATCATAQPKPWNPPNSAETVQDEQAGCTYTISIWGASSTGKLSAKKSLTVTIRSATPIITFAPIGTFGGYDFGNTEVGTSKTRKVIVSNTGSGPALDLNISIDNDPNFSILSTGNTCEGLTRIDATGGATTGCEFVLQYSPTNEGDHYVELRADFSNINNTYKASAKGKGVLPADTNNPVINIITAPSGNVPLGTRTEFKVRVMDSSSVTVGYSTTNPSSSGPTSNLGNGEYLVTNLNNSLGNKSMTITATDAEGNSSSVSASWTVVDASNPVINIITAPSGNVPLGTRTEFKVRVMDSSSVTVGYSTTNPSSSGPTSNLGNGEYLVTNLNNSLGSKSMTITATDSEGNSSSVSASWTVVDSTDPVISILSKPPNEVELGTRTEFKVRVSDASSVTVTYSTTNPSSSGPTSNLGNGEYKVTNLNNSLGNKSMTITAKDSEGNTSSVYASWEVIPPPDTTAPSVSIVNKPSNYIPQGQRTEFEVSVSEANSYTTKYYTSNSSGTPASSGTNRWKVTSTNTTTGVKTMRIEATDASGNKGSKSVTWEVYPSNCDGKLINDRGSDGQYTYWEVYDGTSSTIRVTCDDNSNGGNRVNVSASNYTQPTPVSGCPEAILVQRNYRIDHQNLRYTNCSLTSN